MEHLTTGLPEVVTSASNKTPPFPTHNDPSWEAVPKKVNFDLDATTEISNDQRSSVGEDFEERPGIDHVSVFLTQGANCSPQNTNGYLGNGVRPDSLDSPTDLTFIDIDDANVAHFRRDVSPLSGHMTLPAPKKTTDSEVITPFFLTPFFLPANRPFAFILLCVYISIPYLKLLIHCVFPFGIKTVCAFASCLTSYHGNKWCMALFCKF